MKTCRYDFDSSNTVNLGTCNVITVIVFTSVCVCVCGVCVCVCVCVVTIVYCDMSTEN